MYGGSLRVLKETEVEPCGTVGNGIQIWNCAVNIWLQMAYDL